MTATAVRRAQVEEPLAIPMIGQCLECLNMFPEDDMVSERYKNLFHSREQCAHSPFVTPAYMRSTPEHTQWDPRSAGNRCVNYPDSYRGMPRAYFSVDGADPMRDDALIYDEMLKDDGVETKVDLYAGEPHAHILLMPHTESEKKAMIDAYHGYAWLLGKQVTDEEILPSEALRKA